VLYVKRLKRLRVKKSIVAREIMLEDYKEALFTGNHNTAR
jgi:hypothetical protein